MTIGEVQEMQRTLKALLTTAQNDNMNKELQESEQIPLIHSAPHHC